MGSPADLLSAATEGNGTIVLLPCMGRFVKIRLEAVSEQESHNVHQS